MNIDYPFTIESHGEKIIFQGVEETPDGNKLVVESSCQPGCGPIMHTHFMQDEGLMVVSGKIGYQLLGQEPKFAMPGESVLFNRGVPHKFWAEGAEPLHCKGWIQPANTAVFFISAIWAAQAKSGTTRPELFDGAYLMTRYAAEYDLPEMPYVVKKVVLPVIYFVGRILGKYDHFKDAPVPLK